MLATWLLVAQRSGISPSKMDGGCSCENSLNITSGFCFLLLSFKGMPPPVSYISLLYDASLRTPYFSVSRIVRNKSSFFMSSPIWDIRLHSYGHCCNCLLQWQHLWTTETSRTDLYTTDNGSVLPAVSPGIMFYIFKGHISIWCYLVTFKD